MTERLNEVVRAGLEVHTVNREQALLGRHRLDKGRVGSAAQGGPRGMSTFCTRNKVDPARRSRPTPRHRVFTPSAPYSVSLSS